MKKLFSILVKSSVVLAVSLCAQYCTINFVVGSQVTYLSGISSILPLIGAFGGIIGALFATLLRILFSTKAITGFSWLAFVIPGFCASMYWAHDGRLIRLFLPIVCMITFIIHPVGLYAFAYSLFWLIPIVIYFIKHKNIFLDALASTFIAHAVGSVIWLYTIPMTVVDFMSLIPIVCIERLLFASGMVIMHYLFSYLFEKVENRVFVSHNKVYKQSV